MHILFRLLTICHSSYFLVVGWSLFAFVSYRVSQLKVEYKVYNPFEILGIKSVCLMTMCIMNVSNFYIQSADDKEVKAHYKKLSRM